MFYKTSIFSLLTLLLTIQLATAASDTLTFQIDQQKSSLAWSLDVHHGVVMLKKGTVKMIGNQIVAARVVIQMDSITDQDISYELMRKTLQNILRSNVFFDTKKYPESVFVLDRAIPLPDDSVRIQGDLTITGVTNCVEFNVHVQKKSSVLLVKSAPFYIDRLQWGITSYSTHAAKSDKNFIVSDLIRFKFVIVAKSSGIR